MSPADRATAARAVAFTARRLERCLGDMTLPQFRVLSLVASSAERANRIAEQAAVSRPSLTGLLDGLEARGWVRRLDVVGDRRGVLLEVTDSGTNALAAAEAAMAGALDDLLDTADADESAVIETGLTTLGRVLVARHQQMHAADAAVRSAVDAPSRSAGSAGSPRRAAGTRRRSAAGATAPEPAITAPQPSSTTGARKASGPGGTKTQARVTAAPEPSGGTTVARAGTRR